MWVKQLFRNWVGDRGQTRAVKSQGRTVRLRVEALEDRTLPSSYTAASVSDLIADINAANLAGGSNTIALVAGTTFTLTTVDGTTDGATGLPQIAANDNLTILGNGDTIARSTALGTPAFRLFDVANGASLKLSNVTLQGGLASGTGTAAEGGAIYNQGVLDLSGVTVQNNVAQGINNGWVWLGAGGGIYTRGTLTMEGISQIKNNQALGAIGASGGVSGRVIAHAQMGASGLGGGLFVAGGTASLNGVTISGNLAQGGAGGDGGTQQTGGYYDGSAPNGHNGSGSSYVVPGANGGSGLGGGLYVAGGSLTLQNDTVTSNTANGGAGGRGTVNGDSGLGEGGGLYIDTAALAYLDLFTQSSVKKNHASTSNNEIDGSYSTYP
jgi:hypothetical protein